MDINKYKKIYDDLLKLNIELSYEDIPSPAYIQQKLIQCNNFQHIVERFFIEVTRDLATYERLFLIEKLNIETLKRNILTTNEKIKKIPTGKEREAAVDELLEDKYKELIKLESTVSELKNLLSAIRQKQTTLKGVNSDIKALIKLMDQMTNKLNIGSPEDPEIKKLSNIYREIEKMEEELEDDEAENTKEDDYKTDNTLIDIADASEINSLTKEEIPIEDNKENNIIENLINIPIVETSNSKKNKTTTDIDAILTSATEDNKEKKVQTKDTSSKEKEPIEDSRTTINLDDDYLVNLVIGEDTKTRPEENKNQSDSEISIEIPNYSNFIGSEDSENEEESKDSEDTNIDSIIDSLI